MNTKRNIIDPKKITIRIILSWVYLLNTFKALIIFKDDKRSYFFLYGARTKGLVHAISTTLITRYLIYSQDSKQ